MLIHGNTPRMRTLQVYNDGVGPLSLASLALSGDNDFYVTGATDGIQVAPVSITVTFWWTRTL